MICNIEDRSKLQWHIQTLLANRFGGSVLCEHQRELCPGKRRTRKTDYIHYSCSAIEGGLFVKYAEKLRFDPSMERFLSACSFRHFAVPAFFGDGLIDGNMFGVWQYLPYESLRDFTKCSYEEMMTIVQAAASIGIATSSARQAVPGLRARTLWVSPVAEELKAIQLKGRSPLTSTSVADHIELLAGVEAKVVDRIAKLGNAVLCHNDLSPSNIISDRGRLFILDWETASLSVAGSSLRNLTARPIREQRLAAAAYADGLREAGLRYRADDVFFVMGAVQFFYKIRMAVHLRSMDGMLEGLKSLHPLLLDRL